MARRKFILNLFCAILIPPNISAFSSLTLFFNSAQPFALPSSIPSALFLQCMLPIIFLSLPLSAYAFSLKLLFPHYSLLGCFFLVRPLFHLVASPPSPLFHFLFRVATLPLRIETKDSCCSVSNGNLVVTVKCITSSNYHLIIRYM